MMLRARLSFDPAPLLAEYFSRGGIVHHVPFGVSGFNGERRVVAAARKGWIARYGLARVPEQARASVCRGLLTAAQSRVELAWAALQAERETTIARLARALELGPHQAAAVVALLEREGCVTRADRALVIIASAKPPSWTNYLRAA